MTTDSGANWVFVPIDSQWLRFGEYTLTTGLIPEGYWMDNTYDISADFSWFIYSSGDDVRLLTSRDNGKHGKRLLSPNQFSRYVIESGILWQRWSIYLYISQWDVCRNFVHLHYYGWRNHLDKSGSTMINQPVQNVSFVTTSLGFVSTRESLFIQTTEDAHSKNQFCRFRKTIRQGDRSFQSPNEVTQISANTLETNLFVEKDQSMQGKCLPASSVQLITGKHGNSFSNYRK